ncbi:MAG TPA: DUF2461 domain-containing protein [Bacteroidia bacterium]|jgi:uncharacterized protein (TIGR02453 family)|nr:DUF2461 domain-containing protein [Bacteroidia bacterium]
MIQASTLTFLKNLNKHNNKDWFDANRDAYEEAKTNFIEFVEELILGLAKFDPSVKHQEAKKCVFRINRDVRFSKDKSPYKNNFGASISPGGKKAATPGYYFHLQPGASFLAGGMWQPEPPHLNAIRQEIDYNADEFKKIISSKPFKTYFGGLSEEDKLKTVPKGYDKAHPQIELLKHKSFIVVHDLADKIVLGKDFQKHCLAVCKAIHPMNVFLRRAID